MKKVKINKKKFDVKYTVRALFLYEQITKKPFTLDELEYVLNRYIFAYCVILASNTEEILEWDDFVAACDKDSSILKQIDEIILEQQKLNGMINGEEENDDMSSPDDDKSKKD